MSNKEKSLRHVVMFRFKDGTSPERIETIAKGFAALKEKIPGIREFEWGQNVSEEGLEQGLTHIFCVTFLSDSDRNAYLPHPAHRAFGESVGPFVEKVVVLDYWTTP